MLLDKEKKVIDLLCSVDQRKVDEGLRILYRDFFPMIIHLVKNNRGKIEDVEDVFQEGILVLYNQIKGENLVLSCKLKTYFYSICRNLWLKKLGQQKVEIRDIQDYEDFIVLEPKVLQSIELDEEKKAMLELIGHLGEDCQKMLLYFYYDRLQMKEIAIRMNFANDQVARNKKVKCLKKLEAILDRSSFFARFFK